MQIELYCDCCACRFVAPPETAAEDVVDRMFDPGPWYALGDGATFEDMIFTTMTEYGHVFCPDCGEPVSVSEESLGRIATSMRSRM